MKILGIDYGEKKIGLAISEGKLAEPLGVFSIKYLVLSIKRICQKEKIEKIVIGISEGKMAEKTRNFAKELKQITGLSVEFWNETLTTQQAVKKMIEAGKAKRRRKLDEHAIAAALILQDYLDNPH
ncbi:Holliday junction resolvase RuvX [Candidatus Gottesmanbacteria bacterium]|nr:Holliday junction resolvase RuvX [Candidatus Gottesmanbacteria bacterium]